MVTKASGGGGSGFGRGLLKDRNEALLALDHH